MSVFDAASNCALCSMAKPPGPGPEVTNWVSVINFIGIFLDI